MLVDEGIGQINDIGRDVNSFSIKALLQRTYRLLHEQAKWSPFSMSVQKVRYQAEENQPF